MFPFIIFIANYFLWQKPGHCNLILNPGQYQISCYGAQGGGGFSNGKKSSNGGKGAYTSGKMEFGGNKRTFYACIGGEGAAGAIGPNAGGLNGGGIGGRDTGGSQNDASGGGGGATDLRIDDGSDRKNRIIVAAGGSGGAYACNGAPGGDLTGYEPVKNNKFVPSKSVTQKKGDINGIGGNGLYSDFIPGSGGGGGWRGGISSGDWCFLPDKSYRSVAHSGSSYISGHSGCIKHYKMSFTDTQMKAGFNSGNGKLSIIVEWECLLSDHACKNDSILVKCFDGFYQYNNDCVSSCPFGYVEVNKKCIRCNEKCATCQNSTTSCTSCASGFLYNNQCVSECPNGTVNSGTSCVKCESENGKCLPINLINESQKITLKSGRYRVKCYGAQGGQSFNFTRPFKQGGAGAYVAGIMNVEGSETTFYINVGKIGGSSINETSQGGANGGGKGGKNVKNNIEGIIPVSSSGGGGGATDIRIYDNSTRNRIIIASGGSGASFGCEGAPGGTLTGMIPIGNGIYTKSNITNQNPRDSIDIGRDGLETEFIPQSGGGGGLYGGLTSNQIGRHENESWKSVSESGNSYLSGYEGYVNHKFMIFEEGEMISGYNSGNGKVEIQTEFECPFNCYSCTSRTKCNKCIDNYFLFNKGRECLSKCPVDYSEVDGQCVKCSSPCDTCSSTPSTCTSCIENYSLYQNKCYLSCPTGKVSVGVLPAGLECQSCKSPCLSCSLAVDHCLSCIDGYYLFNNECVTKCPEKTTLIGNKCIYCQYSCSKCTDEVDNCIECEHGYYLDGKKCVLECPTGTTKTSKYCISCESPTSCSTTIKNIQQSEKIILKSGVYKVQLKGGKGGYSYNFTSYYKGGGDGAIVSGTMRIDGEGTTFYCNVGKMGDYSTNKTNKGGIGGGGNGGKYTGSTSNGISSSGGGGEASDLRINDNSTSNRIMVAAGGSGAVYGCNGAPGGKLKGMASTANDYFVESDIVDQINGFLSGIGQSGYSSSLIPQSGAGGGYRGGIITMQYGQNKNDCWKSVSQSGSSYISGYTGCKTHDRMVFTDTKMESNYNTGDGAIIITPQYECSYKCYSCTSETMCTSCMDNYLLYKNRCVLSCPSDSFNLNGKCVLCDSLCLRCQNSPSKCTMCKVGYFLYQNECIMSCPDGFIGLDRKCVKCTSPFSTCTESQTSCTSCIPGYFLYNNKCVNSCPPGFFKNDGICQRCIPPCKTCSSASCCLQCQENYYLYDNQCLRSCPEGYIEVDATCQKCKSPCKTCMLTQDTCTSCEPDLFLYKKHCLTSCPNGTIGVNQICLPCILPCEICQMSQTKCQTCIEGYSFYEEECIDQCPEGFVDIKGYCEKCQENCSACQFTTTECTKCKNGFYLYENTCVRSCPNNFYIYDGKCIPTCPNKTFISEGKCERCDDFCETCSMTKDHCDSCVNGMLIYENHCYEACEQITEEGYFGKNDENQECRKCSDSNCIECSDNYSICNECGEDFYLEKNKCILLHSLEFTNSDEFSVSQIFTQSSHFTETSKFTQSSLFSSTSKFTQSSPFSSTSKFTQSSPFSSTSKFTHSSHFTATSKFTQLSPFSSTSKFAPTSPFSVSLLFTQSMQFSHSIFLTLTSSTTFSSLTASADKSIQSFMQSSHFTHSSLSTVTYYAQSSISVSFESSKSTESFGHPSFIVSEETGRSNLIAQMPTNEIKIAGSKPNGKKTPMIAGISVAIVLIIVSALIALFFILKKKKKKDQSEQTPKIDDKMQESDLRTNKETTSNIQYQDDSDRDIDFWI